MVFLQQYEDNQVHQNNITLRSILCEFLNLPGLGPVPFTYATASLVNFRKPNLRPILRTRLSLVSWPVWDFMPQDPELALGCGVDLTYARHGNSEI